MIVSATTEVGRRKSQEDRFVVCPRFYHDDVFICGVFDGTVGDFASHFVHTHIVHNIAAARDFRSLVGAGGSSRETIAALAEGALREGFAATDKQLLAACRERGGLDYTSSTGVVALCAHGMLAFAHVGDSRIVLATEISPEEPLSALVLTTDHKPDQEAELKRIQSCGGSLTYLHGGKPFIRGGDFAMRQSIGDRPMQLNYSRAFGGKDLKPYGLIVEPDTRTLCIRPEHRILVLASDGVWDVLTPEDAVDTAVTAVADGRNPSRAVVELACETHEARRSADNVTAIVIFFSPASAIAVAAAANGAKGPARAAAAATTASVPLAMPASGGGYASAAMGTGAAAGAGAASSAAAAAGPMPVSAGSTGYAHARAGTGHRGGGGSTGAGSTGSRGERRRSGYSGEARRSRTGGSHSGAAGGSVTGPQWRGK